MSSLPRWVWATLASLSGIVLLLGATALVVSLPILSRLADSQRSLGRVNHIDEQVVQVNKSLVGLDPALDKLDTNTSPLDGRLTSVQGLLDQTVVEITQLRKDLKPLAAQAPALGRIDERLATLLNELGALSGSLESLAQIPGALDELNGALTRVDSRLATVSHNTDGLDTLPELISQLVTVLQQVEKHVANLDQKTGPVLLPSTPTVASR